jgi:hypothetical protein
VDVPRVLHAVEGARTPPATPSSAARRTNFDIADEKGPSANDQRHRLVASGTATMPDDATGWRRALRGFQASVIGSYGSALPYTITTGNDRNNDTTVNDRPEGVGRNTARAWSSASVDLRVSRTFRVGRARTEQLAEAFQPVQPDQPPVAQRRVGTGATPLPAFGTATAAGDPRRCSSGCA